MASISPIMACPIAEEKCRLAASMALYLNWQYLGPPYRPLPYLVQNKSAQIGRPTGFVCALCSCLSSFCIFQVLQLACDLQLALGRLIVTEVAVRLSEQVMSDGVIGIHGSSTLQGTYR